jgi:hypothetical protein
MEAACSSETSDDFQRTTRRYNLGDRTLHNHCCEKPQILHNYLINLPPIMGPEVSLSVHKSPPLDSILNEINPIHILQLHFLKINWSPSHLYLGLVNGPLLTLSQQNCTCIHHLSNACYASHPSGRNNNIWRCKTQHKHNVCAELGMKAVPWVTLAHSALLRTFLIQCFTNVMAPGLRKVLGLCESWAVNCYALMWNSSWLCFLPCECRVSITGSTTRGFDFEILRQVPSIHHI